MRSSISKKILLSLATITALSLSSCGGGGGSSSSVSTDASTATAQNITGKAVDGYLVKSTVCLDLNMDNYCDIASNEEPVTSTDENGSFALTVTAEQQKHKNFAIAPLLVYGGYDADNGPSVSFTGKLRAVRGEGVINITPTTTTIEKMVREQNLTHEDAKKAVRDMLGLDKDIDLGADPIALAKDGKNELLNANLKLHKSLELMADTLKKAQATNQEANKVLKSTNELIDDLYSKLALAYQQDTTQDLDKVFDRVIDDNQEFVDKAQSKIDTEVLGKKINDFIGEERLDSSEKLGAQINSLQNIIIGGTASIDAEGKVVLKGIDGQEIDDTYFDDFVLMHGYEILDIVDYVKNDIDVMAKEVAKVLVSAGMVDVYLPVQKEVEALKSNPLTRIIGEKFEKANKFISGDIKISEDLITLLAGNTLWISTKYDDVQTLEKIIFTPDMRNVVSVEMIDGIVQEKSVNKLFIENNLLVVVNEYGDVDEMKIINLGTIKADGFLLLEGEDVDGKKKSIKLYFDKEVAVTNPKIEKDIYGDYYNGNSTTIDKPIIDLPNNNMESGTDIGTNIDSKPPKDDDKVDTKEPLVELFAGKTLWSAKKDIDAKGEVTYSSIFKIFFSQDMKIMEVVDNESGKEKFETMKIEIHGDNLTIITNDSIEGEKRYPNKISNIKTAIQDNFAIFEYKDEFKKDGIARDIFYFNKDDAIKNIVINHIDDGSVTNKNDTSTTPKDNQTNETTPPKVEGIRGVLVDPYISGSTLYEDANANGEFDEGELESTPTTDKGEFKFAEPLTVGNIVRIKEQGMHEGKKFDLDITAKVDENGSVKVISPITTFQEKGLSEEQITSLINGGKEDAISNGAKYLSDFNIEVNEVLSDPLSGNLMNMDINNLTAQDLSKIQASLTTYGLLKIMNGSTELQGLTGIELEVSQEVKFITSKLLELVTGVLNKDYLDSIAKEIDDSRTALGATPNQMPNVKTALIIQVATKFIDIVAESGYQACNASTGTLTEKVDAGVMAGGEVADKVLGSIDAIGIKLYGAKYRDNLRTLSLQQLAGIQQANPEFYNAIMGTQTTFNFDANGNIK